MSAFSFLRKTVPTWALMVSSAICGFLSATSPALAARQPTRQTVNEFDKNQFRAVPGFPEALVATGPTTRGENAALDEAIGAFQRPLRVDADYVEIMRPITEFLVAHPRSAWAASLHLNLGLGYYRNAYFSKAVKSFRSAWEAGKDATNPQAVAQADRSIGELGVMHSRIGESGDLADVLKTIGNRQIRGPATELVANARESVWTFDNEPGMAFLCGPMALKNLLITLKFPAEKLAELDAMRSPRTGFSMSQVSVMATKAGLKHLVIFRKPNEPVPVPSVVNWKVSHYAAIVEEKNGRYRVKDPTFGNADFWVTKQAIDNEASGYFLAANATNVAPEWRLAEAHEADSVYGKGSTNYNYGGAFTPDDEMKCKAPTDGSGGPAPAPAGAGMCVANAMLMLTSLHLTDTPVGYRPQKGPSAYVTLTYNQREGDMPASFTYFNVGPKWNINFSSFIQDDAVDPNTVIRRYALGGGYIDYLNGYSFPYPDGTNAQVEPLTGIALKRNPISGKLVSWELILPDGSRHFYEKQDGATSGARRTFLTRIQDKTGNTLTLNYDNNLLLTSITDATGRSTTFAYAPNTRRIQTITDPFGRSATLEYNAQGYLTAITDVLGLKSSFEYGLYAVPTAPGPDPWNDPSGYGPVATPGFPAGRTEAGCNQCGPTNSTSVPGSYVSRSEYLVTAMTTPYGRSKFGFGFNTRDNSRYLNMTDPLGHTERIEFRHQAPGIPSSDPDGDALGLVQGQGDNAYLDYRNTFIWDKHSYAIAAGDYTKAKLIHWAHYSANTTSGWKESEKQPLESRTWYLYSTGSRAIPTFTKRLLDDGVPRATFNDVTFNFHIDQANDALGRRTYFTYANFPQDDLTAAYNDYGTVASFTYNSQHKPLTWTDAAGQVTTYTYNAAAQVKTVTNPLGQVTQYDYDTLGRLITVTNANGAVQASFTYDAYDRVATRTDSEGYVLKYAYDVFDRVTMITYPDATTTALGYDKLDLVSYKDRLGRVTTYGYDAVRRLSTVTDPLLRITRYGYHENNALKSITDPKGNVTSWDIDLQSRPTAKHYADGTTEMYAYEPKSGQLKTVTDARGRAKQYAYAADGRVTGISYPDGLTPNVTYSYDGAVPRLVSMTDGIGSTHFDYGAAGAPGAFRLTSEDGPYNNDTVGYGYDKLGRLSSRTIDAATETFEYDKLGRMSRDVNALGDFAMTYLGQTGQMTSSQSATVGTQWEYSDNSKDRRLSGIGSSTAGRRYTYFSTPENRITGINEGSGGVINEATTYSYDAADRLTHAQPLVAPSSSYAYDAADNLTSINGTAATYNAANQIQTLGGVPYTYDLAGNVLDDGTRTYRWDGENRLIGIGYKAQPGQTSTFRYDGFGRRIAIVETSTGGAAETRFLWCGGATPCQARSASDATTGRFYQQGVAITAGAKIYFARDHLGSVRDVLDAHTGLQISSYDFDPYGKQRGAGLPVDFGFAGMFNHQVSGLNLTLFRAYDPKSVRWLSRDPIGDDSDNIYYYVDNNPINFVDPFGLESDEPCPPEPKPSLLDKIKKLLKKKSPEDELKDARDKIKSDPLKFLRQLLPKGPLYSPQARGLEKEALKAAEAGAQGAEAVHSILKAVQNNNRFLNDEPYAIPAPTPYLPPEFPDS